MGLSNSPCVPEAVPNPREKPARDAVSAKVVRCPACGGDSMYAASNPYRPFCSERCKQHDLGAWASESFKLPENQPEADPSFERS